MTAAVYDNFCGFLSTQGFAIVEPWGTKISNTPEEQLGLISEFHKKTMGYSGYLGKRLNNATGKKIEDFKVYLKKIKRDLTKIEETGIRNNFEKLILEQSEEFINRAEYCITTIFKANYYDLIGRSMKRTEICLGNTYHDNLRKTEVIEIADIKHCAYNMVECDGAYYLSKLKRSGFSLNWEELIHEYCILEGLDGSSELFIKAMISYPYEVMKCYNRYRYRKKEWSDEEYESRLLKAFEKDGASII